MLSVADILGPMFAVPTWRAVLSVGFWHNNWVPKSGENKTKPKQTCRFFHSPGYYASENRVDQTQFVLFLGNHVGTRIVAVQDGLLEFARFALHTGVLAKRSKS